MNNKKMFVSFVPWLAFTVLVQRHGASGAAIASLVAAGLAIVFTYRHSEHSSLKLIDAAGITIFGAMAVIAFIGGTTADDRIADYGRGIAALLLGAIMLGSVLFVPFTEQYAREETPREYWHSPVFRSVNRKISAVWGAVVLFMACGHLLAGRLDPATDPSSGTRPVDLVLNWVLPAALVLLAVKYTQVTAESAGRAAGSERTATADAPILR